MDGDSKPIKLSLFTVLTCLGIILFSFCELSQMVTNQFESFGDELGRCNWYLFSIEIQKKFLFALLNTQLPVSIIGFGNFDASREMSKKVKKIRKKNYNQQFLIFMFFSFSDI